MTNYEDKVNLAKTIFRDKAKTDTDHSAVDACIAWMVARDFNLISFVELVNALTVDEIKGDWEFWDGYGDDYERFGRDWLDSGEAGDYLGFVREYIP